MTRCRDCAEAGVDDFLAQATRKTSCSSFAMSRPRKAGGDVPATAPMMRLRWRRPMSASP